MHKFFAKFVVSSFKMLIARNHQQNNNQFHCCFLLLIALLQILKNVNAWMPDVRPDFQPKQDKIIARFFGNNSDYFKILDHDDVSLLVGARDAVYNVSINGLRENSRLEWYSSDADRELCALKGKGEKDCHNYIRVFARLGNGQILLCGTNSYKPRCRHYAPPNNTETETPSNESIETTNSPPAGYEVVRDVEAQGLCPYSPAHNSTYAFADGQLYSATVADFSGSDPLIYRENLRTEQYDLKQLNQPDFVGAIERDGYVLFFFREIAIEYMNVGKTIYSRVGRVCKNDRGGPYSSAKSWTSFLKARLNCSVPADIPFYFDELQSISPVIETGNGSIVYAVFTTSVNAIPGSAVCAFNIDDIMDAFDGRFKAQKDSQSHWLAIQEEQVPQPRPGKCVEDSRMLPSTNVNFIKNHPLMETSINAVRGRPLLTKVNLHHRLTSVAVDPKVKALNGEHYDVIYTGTDDGKVTKFINIPTTNGRAASNTTGVEKLKTVVISEMQVLPIGVPVRDLFVSSKSNTLLVVSDGSLVTVPLHHCAHIVDCLGCLSLQDPDCAWDHLNHECKSLTANNKFGTKQFLQSLNSTKKAAAALCPKLLRGTLNGEASNAPNIGTDTVRIDLLAAHNSHALDDGGSDDALLAHKLHYDKVGSAANADNNALNGGNMNGGVLINNAAASGDLDGATGAGRDFLLNSFNDANKITLSSVDPDDLLTVLNDPQHSISNAEEQRIQRAASGKSFYWGLTSVVIALGFIFGVFFGIWASKRACRQSALHANHRNQFNANSQFAFKLHNTGKDINLLMKPNHYTNQKNLDLEKDRSHECKNSTENLEKELPCKTSTLTKVKRTYI